MKRSLALIGTFSFSLLAGIGGGMLGRVYNPASIVHAQDGYSNCTVAVPKSWGEFKGGSEFGLAFEDQTGTLRFVLHPPCASISTPTESTTIDLKIMRK